MTYSSGGLIQATDYNNRATAVNSIWGVGAGSNGYGQSTTISNVSVAVNAAASEWATLTARLNNLTSHQAGTGANIAAPVSGGIITYLSAVDTNVSNIQTNKLLFNSTRGTASPTGLGNPVMSSSTAWTTSCTKEFSVTFSSTDTVRYFFNAGGIITFYLTQTGGTTSKYSDWADFLAVNVGTISFGSNYCSRSGTGGDQGSATPGGSPTQNTGIGFHSLTTSYQTLFAIGSTSATADYGTNYITIEAKVGGALYGASSNVVYFRCILYDAAGDVNLDLVDGTTALYAGFTPPETTYLTNTWGTPTAATVTNTQNTLPTVTTVEYLGVAGGGGGGLGIYLRANGGGGGGGGVISGTSAVAAATSYTITIGGGGAGPVSTTNSGQRGATGGNTTFFGATAYGGGGGGSWGLSGLTGGSSGGGAHSGDGVNGASPNPTGTGQGYGGGNATNQGNQAGSSAGGGGGAGAKGQDANVRGSGLGGNGGNGRTVTGVGGGTTYAGGGGGAGQNGSSSAGSGGAGQGAGYAAAGAAGGAANSNTGSGGGGGAGGSNATTSEGNGGNGGSGIVIIRYQDVYAAATSTTGSPTISVSGGWRTYTWTGSGSITF